MNWVEIATEPEVVIAKYKQEAVKQGTRIMLAQAAFYLFASFIITDFVVRKYVKKGK